MISKYFKMPYALFLNPKYSELTNNEKLIYSILYSRYEISCQKSEFKDENGIFITPLKNWLLGLKFQGKLL